MSGQRGRKLGHDVMQKTRDKIRATKLVTRLQEHVLGDVEMSTSQVRAAEMLLKKILPDLSSVEMKAPIAPSLRPNMHRLSRIHTQAGAYGVLSLTPFKVYGYVQWSWSCLLARCKASHPVVYIDGSMSTF